MHTKLFLKINFWIYFKKCLNTPYICIRFAENIFIKDYILYKKKTKLKNNSIKKTINFLMVHRKFEKKFFPQKMSKSVRYIDAKW